MQTRLVLILGVILSFSGNAFSQTPVSTSSAPLPEQKKNIFKDIQIGVFGWSYGPAIGNFDQGTTPNVQGPQQASSNATTQIAISAPVNDQWRAVVIPTFTVEPFAETNRGRLQNPTLGIQGTVYTNGGFSYWTRFEAAVPASEASYRDGLVAGPQTVQVLSYRGEGSAWGFQHVVVPGTSFFKNGETSGFLYMSPMISYHINDDWRITLLSEHFWGRERGTNVSRLIETQPDMIGLGFRKTWTLSANQNLFIQPYVNSFPDRLSVDNAHIAFLFGGRLL
jgi:hypothetical protein